MWGHILLGIEVLAGLWLSHRSIAGKIKKVTVEFNGNGKTDGADNSKGPPASQQ